MKPLISVCVVTYNHVSYIKECLDGILMQKTSFQFEIILGEDESNDGTREICIDYANKHPDKVKLFLRSRKDVIYINGKPTGRYNFLENLRSCKGKYVAICEGDDYWIDPLKLQKQVDFLEANLEYSLCFHKVKILKNNNLVDDFITKVPENYQDIESLALLGNYIHTPSVVFRNSIKDFPFEFKEVPFADYFLYMMLAQQGKLYYFDEVMAVYRYQVGIMAKQNDLAMIKNSIQLYSYMISFFKGQSLKKILIKKQQGVVLHYIKLLQEKEKKKHRLYFGTVRFISLLKFFFTDPKLVWSKVKKKWF